MTEIYISAGEGNQQELADLQRWLSTQRELSGRVRSVRTAPGEEQLTGGALDLLSVSLGAGGSLSALAGALGAWLGSRRGTIEIEISGESRRLSVPQGTDPAEIERLITALTGQSHAN
ncbi:effector-associated constant component EACC1 [Streptomyces sp. UC4497]